MGRQQDGPGYHFYGYDAGDDDNDDDNALVARFFAFHPEEQGDVAVNATPPPILLTSAQLDAARDRLERGPGGDVDVEGQMTRSGIVWTPAHLFTIHIWQRLYERVEADTLGGPQDGARQEVE